MSNRGGRLCGFISCGNQSVCHTFLYKHDCGDCVNQLRQILNSRTFQPMLPVALRTHFYYIRSFSHLSETLFALWFSVNESTYVLWGSYEGYWETDPPALAVILASCKCLGKNPVLSVSRHVFSLV